MALITDHVWRPPKQTGGVIRSCRPLDRPCEFMNCRRPRGEHARARTLRRMS